MNVLGSRSAWSALFVSFLFLASAASLPPSVAPTSTAPPTQGLVLPAPPSVHPTPHGLPIIAHRPHAGLPSALRMAKFNVNPGLSYISEPAPMGIADFGIDGSGNAYTYNTSAFYGDIKISSVATTSLNAPINSMGFQLNVVMEFTNGSQSYFYWIQDVASVDTSANSLSFENNIWNFSSSGAALPLGTLTGNGTIYSSPSFYAATASSTLPGSSVTMSYPFDLGLKVLATKSGNQPVVTFEYKDGFGWVTYDVVNYPWATGFVNNGFVVDGTQYNPDNLFNNAELILGGYCCAFNTQVTAAAMHVGLQYWNGHNFQMVTNAFNHGGNTAEGVNDTTVAGFYYRPNGTLYGSVTHAAGSLGTLYDRSTVGILNITSPYQVGSVQINGTSYGNFTRGDMNLTLGPGAHRVSLYENASKVGELNITLPVGGYVPVFFGAGSKYNVTFTETGLPNGTNWSVSVEGQNLWSLTNQIVARIWNGTWNYKYGMVPGWSPSLNRGQVHIQGSQTFVPSTWSVTTFRVSFTSTGLPSNQNWSVTIGSTTIYGINPTITFLAPNGSVSYQVGPVPGFVCNIVRGTVPILGSSVAVPLRWSAFTFPIFFNSTGLPGGTLWNVTLGGVTVSSTSTTLAINAANGSHAWTLGVLPGFHATLGGSGRVTVSAGPATVSLAWFREVYTIAVHETGLPTGTPWQVFLGNLSVGGVGSALFLNRSNGSYAVSLADVPGYVPTNFPTAVTVRGSSVSVPVTFAPMTYQVSFVVQGLPAGAQWSISARSGAVWANMSSSTSTLVLALANGTWSFTVGLPNGYSVSPAVGTVQISGAGQQVFVSAAPPHGFLVGTVVPVTATVTVDGNPVSVTNGAFNVTLSDGLHYLQAEAPGYGTFFENVNISSGKITPVSITLVASPATSPAATGLFGLNPFLLVILLIVIVALAAGIVLALRRRSVP